MTTRVDLPDLVRATSYMYIVDIFGDCGADGPNIAGDTLHILFRSDKCMPADKAEMWVSQIQPDTVETRKGKGYIPVTKEDSDIPEASYHHVVVWERTSRAEEEKHGIIYGKIKIVAGCLI